jgi:hypothetical protein
MKKQIIASIVMGVVAIVLVLLPALKTAGAQVKVLKSDAKIGAAAKLPAVDATIKVNEQLTPQLQADQTKIELKVPNYISEATMVLPKIGNSELGSIQSGHDNDSDVLHVRWRVTDQYFYDILAPKINYTAEGLKSLSSELKITISSNDGDANPDEVTIHVPGIGSNFDPVLFGSFDSGAQVMIRAMFLLGNSRLTIVRNALVLAIGSGSVCRSGYENYFNYGGETIEVLPAILGPFLVMTPLGSDEKKIYIHATSPMFSSEMNSLSNLSNTPEC